MIEGKTKTGFKFKIDERLVRDWRVVSAISMVENGNTSEQLKATTDLVRLILGADEQKLLNHVAKKNEGFVPLEAVTNEVADIISSATELKN